MEAVQAATGINFDQDEEARSRLRLLARMKGGGVKKLEDVRYPTFLGALLDILPRCVDVKEEKGVVVKGYYADPLTGVIG